MANERESVPEEMPSVEDCGGRGGSEGSGRRVRPEVSAGSLYSLDWIAIVLQHEEHRPRLRGSRHWDF